MPKWMHHKATPNALGHRSRIITAHPINQSLGASDDARQAAYRRLFETELNTRLLQRLRERANGGFVLGTDRFAQQIATTVGRRTWKGSPGRPRRRTDDTGEGKLSLEEDGKAAKAWPAPGRACSLEALLTARRQHPRRCL
jgi:putative transposase